MQAPDLVLYMSFDPMGALQCDSMPSPRSNAVQNAAAARGARRGSVDSTTSGGWFVGQAMPIKQEDLEEEEIEMMMEMESMNGEKIAKVPAPCAEEFPILASQNR